MAVLLNLWLMWWMEGASAAVRTVFQSQDGVDVPQEPFSNAVRIDVLEVLHDGQRQDVGNEAKTLRALSKDTLMGHAPVQMGELSSRRQALEGAGFGPRNTALRDPSKRHGRPREPLRRVRERVPGTLFSRKHRPSKDPQQAADSQAPAQNAS